MKQTTPWTAVARSVPGNVSVLISSSATSTRRVVERVAKLAEKHELPCVHIALAWLLQKQPVRAPII